MLIGLEANDLARCPGQIHFVSFSKQFFTHDVILYRFGHSVTDVQETKMGQEILKD